MAEKTIQSDTSHEISDLLSRVYSADCLLYDIPCLVQKRNQAMIIGVVKHSGSYIMFPYMPFSK